MLQLFLPAEYGANEFAWLKSFGAVYRLKGCFEVLHPLTVLLNAHP